MNAWLLKYKKCTGANTTKENGVLKRLNSPNYSVNSCQSCETQGT